MNRVYIVCYMTNEGNFEEEYVTAQSAQEAVDLLFGKGKDHSFVREVAMVVSNWH